MNNGNYSLTDLSVYYSPNLLKMTEAYAKRKKLNDLRKIKTKTTC